MKGTYVWEVFPSHRNNKEYSRGVLSCSYVHPKSPSSLGENEYMFMHGWVSLLCTWKIPIPCFRVFLYPPAFCFIIRNTSRWLCNSTAFTIRSWAWPSAAITGHLRLIQNDHRGFLILPLRPLKYSQVLQFIICPFLCMYSTAPPDATCPHDISEISTVAIVTKYLNSLISQSLGLHQHSPMLPSAII